MFVPLVFRAVFRPSRTHFWSNLCWFYFKMMIWGSSKINFYKMAPKAAPSSVKKRSWGSKVLSPKSEVFLGLLFATWYSAHRFGRPWDDFGPVLVPCWSHLGPMLVQIYGSCAYVNEDYSSIVPYSRNRRWRSSISLCLNLYITKSSDSNLDALRIVSSHFWWTSPIIQNACGPVA